MSEAGWEELGRAPSDLAEARLVLHHAVQLVAAVGQSLVEAAPDDSQQSLSLDSGLRTLLGTPVAGGKLRAGLDPARLVLFVANGAGAPVAEISLAGRTLAEGLAFLASELSRRSQRAPALALPKHPGDFPHHALADGGRFPSAGHESRAFLARLFANTHRLLAGQRAPLRLWPHHFDLACRLRLASVSVGAGVSPGDGPHGLPYWYATLSPPPPLDSLPVLAGGGSWHFTGWIGAELPLARLDRGAAAEQRQLSAFFQSALGAAQGGRSV